MNFSANFINVVFNNDYVKVPEKIKSFIKPNVLKIILTSMILTYFLFNVYTFSPWGDSFSPIPFLLLAPLILAGNLSFFLVIPYSYFLSGLIVFLIDSLKTKKLLLISVIVVFIVLTGIDEPVVNNTINLPDYSCSIDSDCIAKPVLKEGWNEKCVNQYWKYYDSMAYRIFAPLNMMPIYRLTATIKLPLYSCSCVKNKCEGKNLYESTDINDCEKLLGYQKEECIRAVSYNVNRADD